MARTVGRRTVRRRPVESIKQIKTTTHFIVIVPGAEGIVITSAEAREFRANKRFQVAEVRVAGPKLKAGQHVKFAKAAFFKGKTSLRDALPANAWVPA